MSEEPMQPSKQDDGQATHASIAGEMFDRVRNFAWERTPLGARRIWIPAIAASVDIMLAMPLPAALFFGPELRLLYNDAYREILGDLHPAALGEPAHTVYGEVWEPVSQAILGVMAGKGSLLQRETLIPVNRFGTLEDAYWNYSLSPVRDGDGHAFAVLTTCQELTRIVSLERRVRASETRILESIGDAVIVTDADAGVTRMNPVAQALTGWTEEEARGVPLGQIFRIVNESTRAVVESPADKVRRLGTVVGLANHTILIRKDGTEVHIDDSGAPIRDEAGVLTGIVLVFRDVTEKWKKDRKLAAYADNQRFLLALTDHLRGLSDARAIMRSAAGLVGRQIEVDRLGYGEISEDGKTINFETGWSDSALGELSGPYPFLSFGAGNVADLRAGRTTIYDDIWHDPRTADRTQTGIGVRSGVGVPIVREGQLRAVLYVHHGTLRHWTEEEVALLEGVADRTSEAVERARTKETLRLSEDDLRYTVELSEQVQWTADAAGAILDFSPSWAVVTGLSREELLTKGWTEVSHPEDRTQILAAWANSTTTGVPYSVEHRLRTASGEYRWKRSRALPRLDAEGTIVKWYGSIEDIHDRKLAEQALIQSEKLAAVGRLASSIAHEINNPLESVTNLLYLARSSTDLEAVQGYLDTADRELRRVAAITNQTLRFHKQSTKPVEVAADDLLESVLSIYQGRIVNSRVKVERRDRGRAQVRCFSGEIRQVLNNLVGNAIDAMHPDGGRLLLRSREALDRRSGRRGLLLTVADTGSGMSPHTIAKAFEPFFTTKGITGTGLGLWISKEIMARHEGRLRLRSSQTGPRTGTVTTLFLPFDAAVR